MMLADKCESERKQKCVLHRFRGRRRIGARVMQVEAIRTFAAKHLPGCMRPDNVGVLLKIGHIEIKQKGKRVC